ncbi:protein phosphatase 2C domain-containing protein [uncultured Frigoribacterium sp.]|uniref:PP2C family protein-serine/threonine phosphatase n=1 Tax=uncultured Frigoribacterium sp. TaxID=335377 RepID=UPI0028D76F93|nr:protein phosphatase 2C domain-containing protein [uncultured Frigoribacterium sp.]
MTELGRPTTAHPLAASATGLSIDWAGVTDVGLRRAHNEDSYVAEAPVFVVADGMGGHSAGDVASDAVVRRIAEAAVRDSLTTDELEEALRRATADIAVAAAETELGVGTTATGVFLSGEDGEAEFTVFNVGDSRVYLVADGALQQITVDHSVVQEMVDAGLLRAEDAESHPDSNVITRAVGFDVDQRPDYWRIPARAGLRLLVCSDGLTKELSGSDIERVLAEQPESHAAASALVRAAVEAGGRDNVTAVVVDVRGTATELPEA